MDLNQFFHQLQLNLGVHGSTLPGSMAKLAATALAVVVVIGLKRIMLAVAARLLKNHQRLTVLAGWMGLFAYLIIGIAVIRIWFEGLHNFLTFLGIIAVGLTIVSKELILNFVAFWVIIWRELFSIGDRVQVGDVVGDVTRKGILYFSVVEVGNWVKADQSTGRMARIPNALVLTTPVLNYSKGFRFIWNELTLTVAPGGDWKRARDVMTRTAENYASNFEQPEPPDPVGDDEFVIFRRLTPKVYLKLTDAGYELTLRYLCKPRSRRDSENELLERILDALEGASIPLAFK
ncbi:mechanosensitive ion channel family protein [Desulfovibrio oxyclinae]|uniref:mechanosensitive ion channel family protein n=1 Tax=Desulfovibrio oxyclinae TaxID=63560 RepID=UPI000362D892|nr:mechanosensitive ion channel family protein [Desulfovibrio oxyclinae]